ncbi:hypothetical protein [Defluviicoccus vanus]|uniref:Uncharacterized protein n=1 Tax=Defluviicoccus vanus TaxID=111831 RepID=A0A7H1MXX3_9PROT|nr:hypothetical protein [Defluviicoccus vanus]QNT68309.1 hypothetical protein HQ394_01715 [Defluviicoccus vanus]
MINRSLMPQIVLALMTLAGAGCSPALVYGERNSLHVASVQVNDNTSEPLRLNVGFRRTIATKAPPLQASAAEPAAKGDAVSAFSSFNLHSDDGNAATIIDPFVINTKFASGKAARALTSNPQAVAQILNIDLGLENPALLNKKITAVECVKKNYPQIELHTSPVISNYRPRKHQRKISRLRSTGCRRSR